MLSFLSVLTDFPAAGHSFIISGKTSGGAQKFNVSFSCGKSNCDIALMLLCNFADGKVTRSSLANGQWTDGETDENLTSGTAMPLRRGEKFTIYILVGDNRFHIAINDKPFCTYNFKVPANQIQAVTVTGDVENVTQMDHRLVFPLLYPLVNNDTSDIVFSGFIPRKYEPGHVTVINGIASGNPHGEFVVMFFENDCSRQLIHFNPRFDQNDVVVNTMHGCDEYEKKYSIFEFSLIFLKVPAGAMLKFILGRSLSPSINHSKLH